MSDNMDNKSKLLPDELDGLFTSLHDLVDEARNFAQSFLEVCLDNAKPPSKEEFMDEAEQIWEDYFSGK